jgi:hypothetical protein
MVHVCAIRSGRSIYVTFRAMPTHVLSIPWPTGSAICRHGTMRLIPMKSKRYGHMSARESLGTDASGNTLCSDDCAGVRPHGSARTARHRRRGDRIRAVLLRLLTAASLIGRQGQALSGHPPLRCQCRSRARASLRTRHRGPSIMGFEDEVEQSFARPCRRGNGRFKRTYELTSSIVPRRTSFHRWVDLRFSPI